MSWAWTWMLAVTEPIGYLGAVTSTPWRCLLMSWVRNGNPSTDTWGRTAKPISRRSEEHTSELQSHRDLHSFPTRRSSDLRRGDFDALEVPADELGQERKPLDRHVGPHREAHQQ